VATSCDLLAPARFGVDADLRGVHWRGPDARNP
jgi:hypothetical protein